jgi:hypothetical protein
VGIAELGDERRCGEEADARDGRQKRHLRVAVEQLVKAGR